MKKIVGTIAAIALAATSAFAGVGIGAWGRGVWSPVTFTKDGIGTMTSPSWAGWDGAQSAGPRVGISINASSENIGFNIDMNGDGGGIGAGDTQYMWAKPWSWLEIQLGHIHDISARGDACFGAFNWLRNSDVAGIGEDFTFTRLGKNLSKNKDGNLNDQSKGAIVKITPVKGLWIEAAFDTVGASAKDVYTEHAAYAVGYKFDAGHARVQYNTFIKEVNAAFDLTAVENLFLTVGAFIPTTEGLATTDPVKVNLYANYQISAVKLHLLAGVDIAKSTVVRLGLGADIDLGNGIGINADVRAKIDGDSVPVSFLAGATKGFSNGKVGLGVQGTTDSKQPYGASADALSVQIPVTVEYWF